MGAKLLALGACLFCCVALAAGHELPDVQEVGIPAVKEWARHHVGDGERAFLDSGLHRNPSPPSWEGVVVYQIQTDRFNNGDVATDALNLKQDEIEARASGDLSMMPNWRHGGDLQGIRERLGYLADLGVQALWVTPVLHHDGGYHGYCTVDPTQVDPGFGTAEELRSLVKEAHEHGMLVVLDIVINHLCDVDTSYELDGNHKECAETLAKHFWEGNATVSGQAGMNFSQNFFPPFRSEHFFNRCGPNSQEEMQGEEVYSVFGDFVEGMYDYRTDDKDFQQIFTDLHKYWVAYADVDGFRLDAAKHVTQDFLAYFSTEVRAYAETLGKDDFFIIGEVAALNSAWVASTLGDMKFLEPMWNFTGEPYAVEERKQSLKGMYESFPEDEQFPGLPSVYNFHMSGLAKSALQCFNGSSILKDYFSSKAYSDISVSGVRPQQLWTLLEIHDWVRFLWEIPERSDLLKTAVAWLMTFPGSPVLYYGVEQGFNGHCPDTFDLGSENATSAVEDLCYRSIHCGFAQSTKTEDCDANGADALKRQDMFASGPWRLGSAVPEMQSMAYIGNSTVKVSTPWQQDPMLPRDHDVYISIRRMTHVRASCPALARGEIEWSVASETSCGVMAFSRFIEGDDGGDIFVIINPGGGGAADLDRVTSTRLRSRNGDARYVNVFRPSDVARMDNSSDTLALVLENPRTDAGETRIFVREDRLKAFDSALGVALCAQVQLVEPETQPCLGACLEQPLAQRWIIWTVVLIAVFIVGGVLATAFLCWLLRANKADLSGKQARDSPMPCSGRQGVEVGLGV